MLLRPEFERELGDRGWSADSTFVWLHPAHPFIPICSRPAGNPLGMALASFELMPYAEVIKRLDNQTLV